MEFKLYLRMLQKGWWIILLTTLVALASSLVVSFLTAPRYSATARFIIIPSPSLKTSSEVINSNKILADSLASLNVDRSSIDDYTVQAVALPSSSVLELTVTGSDPKL